MIWGAIFFSTLMVYTVIRESIGARTGLTEIAAMILIFAVTNWLLFNEWFAIFFVIVSCAIVAYLYFAIAE